MVKIEELRKKLIRQTKEKMKEKFEEKDLHVIKAITIIENLDTIFNLLAEQLMDWYSYHFPELQRLVKDNEVFLKLVYHLGARENFSEQKIVPHYNNPSKAKEIETIARKSAGISMEATELKEIQLLAANALNLREEKNFLTRFLDAEMKKASPNFSALAGTLLAARMLARAGSLKKLALMPSSAIQLIGAEKSLFQHLKTGSKSPKYGLLFQHPLVVQVKPKQKGKMARTVAGKLSIALKADFFGKKDISSELKKDLEKRVQSLK